MIDEIVITTGARLHFGFFAHRPVPQEVNPNTTSADVVSLLDGSDYGGAGLMIDSPGFTVAVSRGDGDRVTSPQGSPLFFESTCRRASEIVSRYREACPSDRRPPPCRIEIRRIIDPHHGLGSGTQLGLAISQALALLAGDGQANVQTLASRVGRGQRSAVGIHGFLRGGFLIDAGKREGETIATLAARVDVPADWRFLLVTPSRISQDSIAGLSGQAEIAALQRLPGIPAPVTDRLCRLALLEMLPALALGDVERFGEALFEYGVTVGNYFRPVQGGTYADPSFAELASWLRSRRIRGVAQSSWGPTLAVCCGDAVGAESLKSEILADDRWSGCQIQIAAPLNTGAAIQF